jgi:hypothetical protein
MELRINLVAEAARLSQNAGAFRYVAERASVSPIDGHPGSVPAMMFANRARRQIIA